MRATLTRNEVAFAILAIALTVAAQIEIWLLWVPDADEATGPVRIGVRAAAALASVPVTLSIGLGRRLPLIGLGFAIPAAALLPAGPVETSVAVVVALAVAAYRAGYGAGGHAEVALGATAIAGVVAATSLAHPGTVEEPGDLAMLVGLLLGPWLGGLAIRARREREMELESAAAKAEAARRAEAATTIEQERARIARELHDVVAHAISVIVLQARGGRRAMANDPASAAQAMDDIETTASRALAEMRRLVSVLRPGSETSGLEPPPGLAQLDGLVATVREAGLAVGVRIEGAPVELPPGVDLAAYRLIQEALTNTLQHGAPGAPAEVVVRYLGAAIEVEVLDEATPAGRTGRPSSPPPDDRSGLGLIGMRERAAAYGGTLESGPRPGGGFRLLARLPLEGGPG